MSRATRKPSSLEHGENIIDACAEALATRRILRAQAKLQGKHFSIKAKDVDDACAVLVALNDYWSDIDDERLSDKKRMELMIGAVDGVIESLLCDEWLGPLYGEGIIILPDTEWK